MIIGEISGPLLYRQNNLADDHRRDFVPLLYRPNYLADEHRRDFRSFITQTELPRRWTSARFSFLYYTDRITSPMIIGEIFVSLLYRSNYLADEHRRDFRPLLYRPNYLADEHRRDFRSIIIQTELPRRWTSARFSFLYYADRITSPMNIGEIFVHLLCRPNYLADEHRRDFRSFIIQTELPRRWTSARSVSFLYCTDRITSPMMIGEISVRYICEIKLSHIVTFT